LASTRQNGALPHNPPCLAPCRGNTPISMLLRHHPAACCSATWMVGRVAVASEFCERPGKLLLACIVMLINTGCFVQGSIAVRWRLFSLHCKHAWLALVCPRDFDVLLGLCTCTSAAEFPRSVHLLCAQLIFTPLYYAYAPNKCSTVRVMRFCSASFPKLGPCRASRVFWTRFTSALSQ